MNKNKILVSAIIPCFERADALQRLLASLKKIKFSGTLEIIVVDDGSKDYRAIKKVVGKFKCSLLRFPANLGPSPARNAGAKIAKGEFLWFLDSDTEVTDSDLLEKMVSHLKQDKCLAGVGGEMIRIDKKLYAIAYQYFPNWIFFVKHLPMREAFKIYPKFIPTNNLLVSKKDFLSINGFSPYFDMHEDIDFCLRLAGKANSKKPFLIQNDTCLLHHRSSEGREGSKFWFFNTPWNYVSTMHRSRLKLLFCHFPGLLPILPLLDITFTPIVLLSQIFSRKMRSSDVLQKKSKNSSQNFPIFVLFSLINMLLAWLKAWKLTTQSFFNDKESLIKKI